MMQQGIDTLEIDQMAAPQAQGIETLGSMEDAPMIPNGGIQAAVPEATEMLAAAGREGDIYIVHASEGDTVIPEEVLAGEGGTQIREMLFRQMEQMGVDPGRYVVGNQLNSINPETGLPEFFFKKIFKSIKKIFKKVAPVVLPIALSLIPGLQPLGAVALGALGSGAGTLIAGGSAKDALKAAAFGGITAGITSGLAGGIAASKAGGAGQFFTGFGTGIQASVPALGGVSAASVPNIFQAITGEAGTFAPSGAFAPKLDATASLSKTFDQQSLIDQGDNTFAGTRSPLLGTGGQSITSTRLPTGDGINRAKAIDNAFFGNTPRNVGATFPGAGENISLRQMNLDVPAPRMTGQPDAFQYKNLADMGKFQSNYPGATPEQLRQLTIARQLVGQGSATTGPNPALDYLAPQQGPAGTFEQATNLITGSPSGAEESLVYRKAFTGAERGLKNSGLTKGEIFAEAKAAGAEAVKKLQPGLIRKWGLPALAAYTLASATGLTDAEETPFKSTFSDPINPERVRQARLFNQDATFDEIRAPANPPTTFQQIDSGFARFPTNLTRTGSTAFSPIATGAYGGETQNFPPRIGAISGPGTEKSDDVPAMLSDGEFVMTAQAVRGAGNGSRRQGVKNLYDIMRNFEAVA